MTRIKFTSLVYFGLFAFLFACSKRQTPSTVTTIEPVTFSGGTTTGTSTSEVDPSSTTLDGARFQLSNQTYLEFGSVTIGQTTELALFITNVGNQSGRIMSIQLTPTEPAFSVIEYFVSDSLPASLCQTNQELKPGSRCVSIISFTPTLGQTVFTNFELAFQTINSGITRKVTTLLRGTGNNSAGGGTNTRTVQCLTGWDVVGSASFACNIRLRNSSGIVSSRSCTSSLPGTCTIPGVATTDVVLPHPSQPVPIVPGVCEYAELQASRVDNVDGTDVVSYFWTCQRPQSVRCEVNWGAAPTAVSMGCNIRAENVDPFSTRPTEIYRSCVAPSIPGFCIVQIPPGYEVTPHASQPSPQNNACKYPWLSTQPVAFHFGNQWTLSYHWDCLPPRVVTCNASWNPNRGSATPFGCNIRQFARQANPLDRSIFQDYSCNISIPGNLNQLVSGSCLIEVAPYAWLWEETSPLQHAPSTPWCPGAVLTNQTFINAPLISSVSYHWQCN